MDDRVGKQIDRIVLQQQPDGSWGSFHSMSRPTNTRLITTEQALKKLWTLGVRADAAAVQKAIAYMRRCMCGECTPPDRREKVINWDAFEKHMMAAWIKLFVPDDPMAAAVARQYAGYVTQAFQSGAFDAADYEKAYRKDIPKLHAGERVIGIAQFYMAVLLRDMLDKKTEALYAAHLMTHGIYYVYNGPLKKPPEALKAYKKQNYLWALELLKAYEPGAVSDEIV